MQIVNNEKTQSIQVSLVPGGVRLKINKEEIVLDMEKAHALCAAIRVESRKHVPVE